MNDEYKNIQETLANMNKQVADIKMPMLETMKSHQEMMDRISKSFYTPKLESVLSNASKLGRIQSAMLDKFGKSISDTLGKDIASSFNKSSRVMFSGIAQSSITLDLQNIGNFNHLDTLSNALKQLGNGFDLQEPDGLDEYINNENDYVEINETVVRELEIPDSVILPIGNNRVRISTANFIAIIFFIITTFISISMFMTQQADSAKTSAAQIELQEEENDLPKRQNEILLQQSSLLRNLLDSADTSSSSAQETLEGIRCTLENTHSVAQGSEAVPDSAQSSTDNTTESLSTASEN